MPSSEIQRLSSIDSGYQTGDLSIYPAALDSKETLFEVKNNAETTLKQGLTFLSKTIIVESTDGFPDKGVIRIGPKTGEPGNYELVYYDKKTTNTFQNLARGFAGSIRSTFFAGATVGNSVIADAHNAVKDAVLNIEENLGLKILPEETSLNGILKKQEVKFLNPRPIFRAFPVKGPPPLRVRFQNFSTGHLIRHFWDFGDGSTSIETNPIKTYSTEGNFTVTLNVMTSTGGQAVGTKTDYITVSNKEIMPFFYCLPSSGISAAEATRQNQTLPLDEQVSATEFLFVDQTDGDITQRNWIFGDNTTATVDDPDIHTITHEYQEKGTYTPTLIIVFLDGSLKRIALADPVAVD